MPRTEYEDAGDEVRQQYFTRALNWFFNNRKGQPSLDKVQALAKDLYNADEFVKERRTKNK